VRQQGHNVIVYEGPLAEGSAVQMGVQVDGAFVGRGEIAWVMTPSGGRVVRTVHGGPYPELTRAHAAVRERCDRQGLRRTGCSWEIYGDWTDDPSQLETEVLYLLASK
jgi:effector-binding domain-containing protein